MRFRRGSRVEVFSIKEASYGVWRSAEIISGNGHTYNVRYYSFEIANNEVVEDRVPRKIIRPCPPQVDVDRWEAGELVEVLDNNISWKTATVLEVLSGRYYVVRLLGAKAELTVHKVYLRARQSWQDERWVMIGKETSVASLRVLKRPSPCDWAESAESCTRSPKKIRSLEEEGHQHRFASSSAQKVYNDSSERRGVELYVKASCNENKSGFRQMVRVRSKRFSECVGTGNSVSNSCYDTDASSVGSCSPISYDESDKPTSFLDGADSCSSDAESSKEASGCRDEARRKHSLSGNGSVVRSCRPELYTYRSTLTKLFASGSLSWDQEASLTDLRLSLNISNDEHLMELRNLKSAGTHS
ncbi:unnamed protein product [Arabidopsis thaliana]|uniref:ENT domain-containing protein n=1 Tax=Arabidopsis thaliana TaxID=3702 RepID=A0A654EXJ4_ARATH|nr:unnamed protein product [Arabidopsis thaliana]